MCRLRAGSAVPDVKVARAAADAGISGLAFYRGIPGSLANSSGIFLGSAAENQIRTNAMAGTLDDYELSFEDGAKLRGRFLIQKLDYAGDFNGERIDGIGFCPLNVHNGWRRSTAVEIGRAHV